MESQPSLSPFDAPWNPTAPKPLVQPPQSHRLHHLALSADGGTVVFVCSRVGEARGVLQAFDRSTQKRENLHEDVRNGAAVSSNGRSVAFRNSNGVCLLDRDSGQLSTIAASPGTSRPSISGDGLRIAWSDDSGSVFVYDVPTGSTRNWPGSEPSLSADGQWLAFLRRDGAELDLCRLTPDGEFQRVGAWEYMHPLVNQDGVWVFFESHSHPGFEFTGLYRCCRYPMLGGASERVSIDDAGEGVLSRAYLPSTSADGWRVAYQVTGRQGGVMLRDCRRSQTYRVSWPNGAFEPQLSADGRTLVFRDRRQILIVEQQTSGEVTVGDDFVVINGIRVPRRRADS
jgi:Tol biopolymer transport system component